MHQQEADDADAQRHRRDVEDATEDVEKHQSSGQLPMEIGEKSWNQFLAWMKFFTLGLSARAFTSCVTIRNSASFTIFSCTFCNTADCSFGSKVLRTSSSSLSISGSQ